MAMTSHPTVGTPKRTPLACSSCRKKKIKCQPSFTDSRCKRCKDTDAECNFAFFPVISGQTSTQPYSQQDVDTVRVTKLRASHLSVDGLTIPPDPEVIEDPKTPGVPMKAPEHPLQFSWTIYHESKAQFPYGLNQPVPRTTSSSVPNAEPPFSAVHPPKSTEYEAGLTVIGEFDTAEGFCRYLNWLKPPSTLEKNSNYHIFKSGIKPVWEDPANANGGKWVLTMKNNPALLDCCWNGLAMALVGEELADEDEICGAIVSLKSEIDRIQVWTRSKDDIDKLNGIGKRLVKLLNVSEADNIGLEFQFNSDDRPPPNKYLSIQSASTSSFRPGSSFKTGNSSQEKSPSPPQNSGPTPKNLGEEDTQTYWFAAEHARRHAVSCKVQIATIFNRYGVQEHQYAVYAGFDELLIKNRGGYLEQIHVMSSVALTSSDHTNLFSDLGKIFSPFSALLFTSSSIHEIPVYKSDGSTWELDELIYRTAKRFDIVAGVPPCSASGMPPDPCHCPPVVSLSYASCRNSSAIATSAPIDDTAGDGSKQKKSKGKEKDELKKEGDMQDEDEEEEDMDGDGDPDSDPDPYTDPERTGNGRVVINLVSEIYSNHQRMKDSKQGDFQRLSMRGAFFMRVSKEDSETPSLDVKFTDLRFGSVRAAGNTAYHQYHLRVEIASGSQTADITGISPCRTSAFHRAVRDSSTTQTFGGGGLSFACGMKGVGPSGSVGMHGTMSNERSQRLEMTRFLNQISETSCDGTTCWEFTVDDPTAQASGLHLPDDRLPTVNFRFLATPLPNRVSAAIVSFWSLVTPECRSQSWLSKLFYGASSHESKIVPAYSNLCQVVTVALSPKLRGEYQHKARLYVNSGDAALDYHARTECILPPTSDVDISTDITNARCPTLGPSGARLNLGASFATECNN